MQTLHNLEYTPTTVSCIFVSPIAMNLNRKKNPSCFFYHIIVLKKLKINKSKITLKYFQPSLSKLIDWLRVDRGKFQRFTNNKKPINMNNIGKCIGYGIYAINNSAGFLDLLCLRPKKA